MRSRSMADIERLKDSCDLCCTDTVRQARLGYVHGSPRAWQRVAGLDVPCGITIPWWEAETLWAVKVRRAKGALKYQQIAGGSDVRAWIAALI
jgi:hypothetical protein